MDDREKKRVIAVINLLRRQFADNDGEFENDAICTAVNMLFGLIDPDFDEVD